MPPFALGKVPPSAAGKMPGPHRERKEAFAGVREEKPQWTAGRRGGERERKRQPDAEKEGSNARLPLYSSEKVPG